MRPEEGKCERDQREKGAREKGKREKRGQTQSKAACYFGGARRVKVPSRKKWCRQCSLHWRLLLLVDGNPFREAAEGKKRLWSVPVDPQGRQVRDKTDLQRRVTFRRGGNDWPPPPYSTVRTSVYSTLPRLLYLTGAFPHSNCHLAECGWSGRCEERVPPGRYLL